MVYNVLNIEMNVSLKNFQNVLISKFLNNFKNLWKTTEVI